MPSDHANPNAANNSFLGVEFSNTSFLRAIFTPAISKFEQDLGGLVNVGQTHDLSIAYDPTQGTSDGSCPGGVCGQLTITVDDGSPLPGALSVDQRNSGAVFNTFGLVGLSDTNTAGCCGSGELFIDNAVYTNDPGGFQLPDNDFAWRGPDSGDWAMASLWTPLVGPPGTGIGFTNHSATLGDVIAAPKTAFRDTVVSVHAMTFDSGQGYAIAGQGSVTFVAGTQMGSVDPPLPDLSGDSSIDVVQGQHQFQLPVTLDNDTTADVASSSTLTFHNALNLMGNTLTKTGDGDLQIRNDFLTGGGTLSLQQGMVSGNGTVSGDVVNDGGSISPGNLNMDEDLSVVPEPASVLLCLLGLFGAASIFWRKHS